MAVFITNPPGSGGGGASDWSELTGKPSEFPPEAHTHPTSEVTGLDAALAAKQATLIAGTGITIDVDGVTVSADAQDWEDITGKPTEFEPADHSHVSGDVSDLTTVLANYSLTSHTHTIASMTDAELATGTENDFLVFGADDVVISKTPAQSRALLGIDTRSATVFVETPSVGTYYVSLDIPFSGTIATARHILASGSLTFSVQINAVNVTGITSINPTSTAATATATAANTFSSAAVVAVVVSAATSASRFAVTIEFTH
jgi:hypothetical protein